MQLTDSQTHAFETIVRELPTQKVILLEGSAGTGKTTLTKYICNFYKSKRLQVCAVTPTHKSKKVIQAVLNENTLIPITAMTVASALGKIKEHSYIGTKKYSQGNNKKLTSYQLFIIDEVSMIQDSDLNILIQFVRTYDKEMLIIGDSNQIPCPSAKYAVLNTTMIEKADNYIFRDDKTLKIKLTEIVRQTKESPIIQLATYVKDHLLTDLSFEELLSATSFTSLLKGGVEVYETFQKYFHIQEVNSCRIIAYTNASVKTHNQQVRKQLGFEGEYVLGELMTGYSNVGWPELIIENGEDYVLTKITHTARHMIRGVGNLYSNLSGVLVDLFIPSKNTTVRQMFIIDIECDGNRTFLLRLIELGEKVNQMGSSKTDFRNYMELKNSVLFVEDLYKMDDKIYTDTSFKETHPLLFTNVNEVIINNIVKETPLEAKLTTAYPDIVVHRLEDRFKPISDSEMFADKFKVIEKDIYYGYALTAHKSQGSTYEVAIVDEQDFGKIINRWNFKHGKLESRVKEKNQLRYVAYTRAKHQLYIIYQAAESEEDEYELDYSEFQEEGGY
jgi:energy-coupling factor transporter ATP-binding protein EcfA2